MRFPLSPAPWLRRYDRRDLPSDLIAGITVAVMLVPQGMAYALLAGMPPVAGLYASTVPLVAYALVGSSRSLAVGPVAIMSLLTLAGVGALAEPGSAEFIGLAGLLALMVGVLQLALGLLRGGVIVAFLSHAVVSGFTSAAAIVIGLSQLTHLLGVSLEAQAPLAIAFEALRRLGDAHPATLAVGLGAVALLLAGTRLPKRFPTPLVVVVLATTLVALLGLGDHGVRTVGVVPAGLPIPTLPDAPLSAVLALLPTALAIAFVGFMESIAVARSLSAKDGERIDADRELVGLGLANLAAGMLAAFPVTGGFSRSAVNHRAGARSGLATIVTALLVAITLLVLTPLFRHLPQAALAALVIVAVAGLVDANTPRHLWRVRRSDALTLAVTFLATLTIGVEQGILSGVGFSLAVFVWRSAFPHVAVMGRLDEQGVWRNVARYPDVRLAEGLVVLRPDASLYFANATYLRDVVERTLAERDDARGLVLDLSAVNDVDAVGLDGLDALMRELDQRGVEVHLAGMKGPVRDVAARAGWRERHAERAFHVGLDQAVAAAAAACSERAGRALGVTTG
ncbi:MAG: sulfate permease [Trueperaceae bacterium]|nr:MAG: sulfate permease [Trueperaceae bacterium]